MRQPRETTLFVWGAIVLTVAFFLIWYILPIGWTAGLSFFQWSPGNPANRLRPMMAKALSLPDLTSGPETMADCDSRSTWPDNKSTSAGPAPR